MEIEYQFKFIEADDDLRVVDGLRLLQWIVSGSLRNNFVSSCIERWSRVAVEWGFHPDYYVDNILALRRQGAKIIWLTGDEAVVYPAYAKAKRSDPLALEARRLQMLRIKSHSLPTRHYRIIETTRGDGFKPFAELDDSILRD